MGTLELAKACRVSPRTIQRWTSSGRLRGPDPVVGPAGKGIEAPRVHYSAADVETAKKLAGAEALIQWLRLDPVGAVDAIQHLFELSQSV